MRHRRHVVMFSSGAGSAVAAKRVADRFGTEHLTLLFADVNGEHGDNYRFLREAAEWVGGELVVLDNGGMTIWQVFAQERFLGNTMADPCSRILKREPMRKWLDDNCDPEHTTAYLGFDWTEEHRMVKTLPHWAPWALDFPLGSPEVADGWLPLVDKSQALERLRLAGIRPPVLTERGFPHANCGGGCIKAGIGQFVNLWKMDPAEYAKWEWNEERLRQQIGDHSILRDRKGGTTKPLTLRALRLALEANPNAYKGAPWGGCNCFTPPLDLFSVEEVVA